MVFNRNTCITKANVVNLSICSIFYALKDAIRSLNSSFISNLHDIPNSSYEQSIHLKLAQTKAPDPAEAINEYMDRQRRKYNLIVRNVAESSKQGKSEQADDNTAKLSDLFHKEFGWQDLK